jgi:hypothetical protein
MTSERTTEILLTSPSRAHVELLNGDCLAASKLLLSVADLQMLGFSPFAVHQELPRMTHEAFTQVTEEVIEGGFNPAVSCEWLLSLDLDAVLDVVPVRHFWQLVHPQCFRPPRTGDESLDWRKGAVYRLAEAVLRSFPFSTAVPNRLPAYLRWTLLVCQMALQLREDFPDDTDLTLKLRQRIGDLLEEVTAEHQLLSEWLAERMQYVEVIRGLMVGTRQFLQWGLLSTSQMQALPSFERTFQLALEGLDQADESLGERSRINHWRLLAIHFYSHYFLRSPAIGKAMTKVLLQDHRALWPLDLVWLMDSRLRYKKTRGGLETTLLPLDPDLQAFVMEEACQSFYTSATFRDENELPEESKTLLMRIPVEARLAFARRQLVSTHFGLTRNIANSIAGIASNPYFNPKTHPPLSIRRSIEIYFEAIHWSSALFGLQDSTKGTVKIRVDLVNNLKMLGFMLALCIIYSQRPPFLIDERQVALLTGYIDRSNLFIVFPELRPSPLHRQRLVEEKTRLKIEGVVMRFQQTLPAFFMFTWSEVRQLLGYT